MWYYRLWDILWYFYLKYLVFQAMWYYQLWDILWYYLPEISCISGYVVLSTWGYFSVLFTLNSLFFRPCGTIDLGVFCGTIYLKYLVLQAMWYNRLGGIFRYYLPEISCTPGFVVLSTWGYFAVLHIYLKYLVLQAMWYNRIGSILRYYLP